MFCKQGYHLKLVLKNLFKKILNNGSAVRHFSPKKVRPYNGLDVCVQLQMFNFYNNDDEDWDGGALSKLCLAYLLSQ